MDKLDAIIRTLEMIEVHGSANLNRLLGCIQELSKIKIEMDGKDEKNEQ